MNWLPPLQKYGGWSVVQRSVDQAKQFGNEANSKKTEWQALGWIRIVAGYLGRQNRENRHTLGKSLRLHFKEISFPRKKKRLKSKGTCHFFLVTPLVQSCHKIEELCDLCWPTIQTRFNAFMKFQGHLENNARRINICRPNKNWGWHLK